MRDTYKRACTHTTSASSKYSRPQSSNHMQNQSQSRPTPTLNRLRPARWRADEERRQLLNPQQCDWNHKPPDRQRREQRGRPWRHRLFFSPLFFPLFFGRRLTPAMYSASALCIVKLLGNRSSGACFVYLCCDYIKKKSEFKCTQGNKCST